MSNRNITLSLPEDLIRRAKVVAAQRETSVSAMVTEALVHVVGEVDDYETLWAAEEEVMEKGVLRVGRVTWSRDDLHRR